VLGHFKIGSLLGRGQSGLVFRAQNTNNNHVVALKVLSADFPKTEPELQRFIKAMKITPQLAHNHLVAIQGAGRSGPYCWIAREFIEGESVARLIHRSKEAGKFDWTRACRVAVHIGKALYFLHEHKVTHGNITPRNILVRNSDRVTKLADLMLNQALEGSKLQKAILGQKLVAELPYMAPEQTDPHATVAPRSDFYSLGVVLYALLTGQPPFVGDTPKDVLGQIREGKPEKPSKLQKGIPPDFEAAVLKMMARRPEDRFPTAVEMLGAVETIAQEHGVQA
jgi:serine/threonine-protein kinase